MASVISQLSCVYALHGPLDQSCRKGQISASGVLVACWCEVGVSRTFRATVQDYILQLGYVLCMWLLGGSCSLRTQSQPVCVLAESALARPVSTDKVVANILIHMM